MANVPTYIVVHHSGVTGTQKQFELVNDSHQRRGFPRSRRGLYGGYHRFIEKPGKILTYREDDEVGAHAVAYWPPYWGINAKSIGICLAGDFTKEKVTMEQLRSLRSLLDYYQTKYDISDDRVLLHRQVKATSCPGVDLLYLVENLIEPDYQRIYNDTLKLMETALESRQPMLRRKLARTTKLLDEQRLSGLPTGDIH